ncbi:type III secretion protein [Yersinia hibernica]|uniref:Type III secretion protein n=1 Tax=Yersinia enterocolitica LC20 TaxID=1443113 RepID=A0A7U4K0J7_YEREN|nr:type III secretion protein [Yersinia hibernica]AHM72777.1 type III secretion protein [Yersinia hibernica]OVZ78288.1 type III secretion protein [Yersinia kristensenii]
MKVEDQRMMSILYAPASYAHLSHLPEMLRAGEIREDTLLNFWLLKCGKLGDLPAAWQPSDATLSLLLARWHLIPIAAHLIGGYLLRNRLPEQGAVLMSDPRLLAFISLPLLHQVTLDGISSPVDTVSCGAVFILGQFPELPAALRQRLMLHFPSYMAPAQFPAPKTLNHINLLRMAFTYAHHYY